jgi:hypothetical protein
MPAPLETPRSAAADQAATPERPAESQMARPLRPGFKPSHSASPPAKILEMPVERRIADPWALRAELTAPVPPESADR